MFDFIEYETAQGVATVRLDRPNMRNALDRALLTELQTALERAESAKDVYAVVLTGNGTAFSAGGDISSVQEWQTTDRETFEEELGRFQRVVEQLRSMGTPSIAAVNGPAIGAGCDIALACDVRFVASDAELIEGFVSIGLISGDGGAWLLPRLIGESKAKRHLLTGDPIHASEAVEIGLAIEETDDLLEDARQFALRLTRLPAEAVRRTKKLATTTPETLDEHMEQATAAQWACLQDDEHVETLDARLEDREPNLERPN